MSEKYEEERKTLLYKNSNGYTVISEAERERWRPMRSGISHS